MKVGERVLLPGRGQHRALAISERVLAEWLMSVGRGRVISWSILMTFQALLNLEIPPFSGPDHFAFLNVDGIITLGHRRQSLVKSFIQVLFTTKCNA